MLVFSQTAVMRHFGGTTETLEIKKRNRKWKKKKY